MFDITESFAWLTPEAFNLHSVGKNTIKIKGIAMPSGTISKNNRQYVEEALIKSAYTLIGKPITINHDPHRIIGNVEWAEHEDGVTEYLATVKKQPYVDMLRNRDPNIKGVSVEADYLHNKCTRCGKRCYSEEEFRNHMLETHLIKDGVTAPHGMVYKALSLVLSPEVPGVDATTVEIMETWGKPLSQLLETVTNDKKQQITWETKMKDKIVVQPENRSTLDRIKEQSEEPQTTVGPAPAGPDMSAPASVPDTALPAAHPTNEGGQECEPGFHWDAASGTCIADPLPSSPTTTSPPIGPSVGETSNLKVPTELPVTPATPPPPTLDAPAAVPDTALPSPNPKSDTGKECPVGSSWDEYSGTCIPDAITSTSEIKFTSPLKLGEPFANYDNIEACIEANPDKDDPAAYCATLKSKAEKEPASEMWSPERGYIRDLSIASKVNEQGKQLQELYMFLTKIREDAIRPVTVEAKLRSADIKKLQQELTESKSTITKLQNQLKEYSTQQKSLIEQSQANTQTLLATETAKLAKAHNSTVDYMKSKLEESFNHQTKTSEHFTNELKQVIEHVGKTASTKCDISAIRKIESAITETASSVEDLRSKVDTQKTSYETIIAAVDKKYGELKEEIKPLEIRIKEQEDELQARKCEEGFHYDEAEGKCVADKPPEEAEETKKLKETVQGLSVKFDNLSSKLKGNFQSQNKPLKKESTSTIIDKTRTGN